MDWFEIADLGGGVIRLGERGLPPLHAANIYLLPGESHALLIDAGTGVSPLAPVVRRLTPLPVTCLLTHGHFDHIGGAHEFSSRLCHPLTERTLAEPTPEATLWKGWLTQDSFKRLPFAGFSMQGYRLRPAAPTGLLADGDMIDLGGRRLTVVHLPGHAPDLVGVHEPASGALFTSDALYGGRMFFDLPGSDPAAALASAARIEALGPRIVHPGHFGSLAGDTLAAAIKTLRDGVAAGARSGPA